jgi:hypothetical protein
MMVTRSEDEPRRMARKDRSDGRLPKVPSGPTLRVPDERDTGHL